MQHMSHVACFASIAPAVDEEQLVMSRAATLTSVQQRGKNHHRRARAKRISSTRKMINPTKPFD